MNTPELPELERQADAARARLLEVVDAIDSKRHALKAPATAPKRNLGLIALVPLAAAASGAASLVAAALLPRNKRGLAFDAVLRSAGMALLSYGLFEGLKVGFTLKPGAR